MTLHHFAVTLLVALALDVALAAVVLGALR